MKYDPQLRTILFYNRWWWKPCHTKRMYFWLY